MPHAFRYRVFMMYLDLAELDRVFAGRWLWSTRRPAVVRFRREDYLGDPSIPLDVAVRELVRERTGRRPSGPIRLLTNLSFFGYCFNPLSLYYCFDESDARLETIVAEVTNTPWGERCSYVLTGSMNVGDDDTQRFRTRKMMHVSPFMDMEIVHEWLVTRPSDDLVVRINNHAEGEQIFDATLILRRSELSGAALARVLAAFPFMTFKVMLGIHWEALKLWLKGCPVKIHPNKRSTSQTSQCTR